MLLPLIINPSTQQKALLEGVDYISSLVVRFTTIERLYRQQGFGPKSLLDQDNFEELNRTFEGELTKLYTQILKYQAQVVCQMGRHTFIRNGRDIFKLDDWSTLLDDIKKEWLLVQGSRKLSALKSSKPPWKSYPVAWTYYSASMGSSTTICSALQTIS